MPLLRATQLPHSIGQQIVLDNAELHLEAGDRVCILGRNGCGKSTLLRIVDGNYHGRFRGTFGARRG